MHWLELSSQSCRRRCRCGGAPQSPANCWLGCDSVIPFCGAPRESAANRRAEAPWIPLRREDLPNCLGEAREPLKAVCGTAQHTVCPRSVEGNAKSVRYFRVVARRSDVTELGQCGAGRASCQGRVVRAVEVDHQRRKKAPAPVVAFMLRCQCTQLGERQRRAFVRRVLWQMRAAG
ncbi:hypothetical protein ERJ75_000549400 [Trypanosoma vivax]|nr:hypothetical protein ERJ75_000549400 [Trypanosoma vivax]